MQKFGMYMKIFIMLAIFACALPAQAVEDFYELKAKKINGDTLYFAELKGKKLMLVNVASLCGYTYQYAELQQLYDEYKDKNFEIIGFPANNFGNQEPGSDDDINNFCRENYGVTFTMMSKVSVKGADKHPVYQWLTEKEKNGSYSQEVLWNFQKYLVSENGRLEGIYGSQTSPLHQDIKNWIYSASSVELKANAVRFSVTPNPANEYIEIDGLSDIYDTIRDISIFNSLGARIASFAELNSATNRIDVSIFPAGLYFIMIGNHTSSFIKY